MRPQLKEKLVRLLGPYFHPLHVIYLLFSDWKSWRSFPAWFRSFRPGYLPLQEGRPWLPFKAANWLGSYVTRSMKVFEFGSGGSTIFLSKRAGQLFCVEHDNRWHALVSAALAENGITNCSYELREPRSIVEGFSEEHQLGSADVILDEREWEYPSLSFDPYVNTIDAHPDHMFDLVLVDGRARAACIRHALPKIRTGGYLMLDNSNDSNIVNALGVMESHERIDFHGVAPGWPPARWTTSVWRMRSASHDGEERSDRTDREQKGRPHEPGV
jgi:hypothetical protein